MGKRSVSTVSVKDSQILRECPFCGGEAEMLTAESMNGGYLFGIMCNDCRSRGDVYDTEAEAIAAWNTRTATTDAEFARAVHDGNLWRRVKGHIRCRNCGLNIESVIALDGCNEHAIKHCTNCGARVVE